MFHIRVIAVLAITACVLAVSQTSMARDFGTIFEECGLGGMIAPTSPGAAAATNVTWDSGTTAISSEISTPESCTGGQEKVASFIHDSYESLEEDFANGHGTYLDTLMALAGYDLQAKPRFIETLRHDFAAIVATPGYTDHTRLNKAAALYDLIYRHADKLS